MSRLFPEMLVSRELGVVIFELVANFWTRVTLRGVVLRLRKIRLPVPVIGEEMPVEAPFCFHVGAMALDLLTGNAFEHRVASRNLIPT